MSAFTSCEMRMFKLWLFCFVPEAWGVVALWGHLSQGLW